MKNFMKIAAVAALMIVSGNINAQDEFGGKKGNFGTEIQFNPFSNNFETFRIDGLSFRYFISDEHALRLKFNVELDNTKTGKTLVAPVPSDYTTTVAYATAFDKYTHDKDYSNKITNTNFGVNLGYEYHFAKYGRADLYAGAQVGIGIESWKQTEITPTSYNKNAEGYSTWVNLTNELKGAADTDGDNLADEFSKFAFGAGVFTGVDFYITKGLYVGAELGINFATAKAKNYDFKQQWLDYDAVNNVYSVKNQTTTVENNIKATSLKFEVEPALRLGWKF